MNNNLEQAMLNYFHGGISAEEKSTVLQAENTDNVYDSVKADRTHSLGVSSSKEYNVQTFRHVADDNIDDVEQLAEILKKLCNAAWGANWGELSPDLKKGENSDNIILPQITVDINTRDVAENMGGLKPKLVDIVDETDANGKPTGDAFLVYRQWFDCNVEFNFYGRTNKEARQLQKRFENLLNVYTGYLKRQGVSEMFFEREVSPKSSLNYDESTPMRCIYYYIRFESIMPIRQSLINNINVEIGASELSTDKVKTLINNSSNNSDPIELDFFDGDNGITYNL
jgi:hypothetical protein